MDLKDSSKFLFSTNLNAFVHVMLVLVIFLSYTFWGMIAYVNVEFLS